MFHSVKGVVHDHENGELIVKIKVARILLMTLYKCIISEIMIYKNNGINHPPAHAIL